MTFQCTFDQSQKLTNLRRVFGYKKAISIGLSHDRYMITLFDNSKQESRYVSINWNDWLLFSNIMRDANVYRPAFVVSAFAFNFERYLV